MFFYTTARKKVKRILFSSLKCIMLWVCSCLVLLFSCSKSQCLFPCIKLHVLSLGLCPCVYASCLILIAPHILCLWCSALLHMVCQWILLSCVPQVFLFCHYLMCVFKPLVFLCSFSHCCHMSPHTIWSMFPLECLVLGSYLSMPEFCISVLVNFGIKAVFLFWV